MSDGDSQDAVFALLSDPATHGGDAVKRIDTHAASVFLAGERAFKVKRAVRFSFLDFSTLAKRKSACEAELRINRSFAPDIYRRVTAITRETDGRLILDGTGTPVEWVLEMRRFDENATLDRLAQAGKVDRGLADLTAEVVGLAHLGEDVGRPQHRLGRDARVVEAAATDLVLLDHRRLHPQLRSADRGDVAAGTGTDHDAVKGRIGHRAAAYRNHAGGSGPR